MSSWQRRASLTTRGEVARPYPGVRVRPGGQSSASAGRQWWDGSAARPSSPPHHVLSGHAGSHRRQPVATAAKTTSTVPKFVNGGWIAGVHATVQYHSSAVESPAAANAAPPAAESSPAPKGTSATASASHGFGFEH